MTTPCHERKELRHFPSRVTAEEAQGKNFKVFHSQATEEKRGGCFAQFPEAKLPRSFHVQTQPIVNNKSPKAFHEMP